LLAVLAACGRARFDALADADRFAACRPPPTAPDPITIRGQAGNYTTYQADSWLPESGVTVTAHDPATGALISQTTTGALGDYALAVTTSGRPRSIYLASSKDGLLGYRVWFPVALAGDLTDFRAEVEPPGDADALYGDSGTTRDPARGSIVAVAFECTTRAVIEGVTFELAPAASTVSYPDASGAPSAATSTQLPKAIAWHLNAPLGSTRVVASRPGFSFEPVEVNVEADSFAVAAVIGAPH
jgi:hypothetical protein